MRMRLQLVPTDHTTLSSEINGRISELHVREGESFEAGDLLLQLDCSLHQARLDKVSAEAEEATKVLAVNRRLDALGSISTLEVDVAAARLAAAEAESRLMQAMKERCHLHAPFAGQVATQHIRRHQYVGEGQELLEILDNSSLEAEFYIPSRRLRTTTIGDGLHIHVEETGASYPARISRIGAAIDPISQSVKIYAELDGHHPELRAGMSGNAQLD